MSFVATGVGVAGLGLSAYQYFHGQSQKKKADAQLQADMANRPTYKTPQSVLNTAADAQSRLNADNPATIAAKQALQQQSASQAGFAQRNASSGGQAIQAAADANAQMYSAIPSLAAQDQQYRQQNIQNYYSTQNALTDDSRIKFQDQLAANDAQQQYQLGMVGAAQQDKSQALALGVQSAGMLAGAYARPSVPQTRTQQIAPQSLPLAGQAAYLTQMQGQYPMNAYPYGNSFSNWFYRNP